MLSPVNILSLFPALLFFFSTRAARKTQRSARCSLHSFLSYVYLPIYLFNMELYPYLRLARADLDNYSESGLKKERRKG